MSEVGIILQLYIAIAMERFILRKKIDVDNKKEVSITGSLLLKK